MVTKTIDKRINIKDLAKILNVSTATISRAFNNKPGVSQKLKKEILKKSKQLDYYPSSIARNFATTSTDTIGVVIPHRAESIFSDYFTPEVLSGIEDITNKIDYNLQIITSQKIIEEELSYIRILKEKKVDGLILMGLITGTKSFLKLEDSNLPYITIGKSTKNQKGSFVDLDHFKAAEIIVEHLVEQHKRKKIYLITGFSKFLCYENYINGYKSALMKYNLPFDNSQVKEGNTDEKDGYLLMKDFLDCGNIPDAVITSSDAMAIGAIEAINEKRLKVPEDIAVTGFCDFKLIAKYLQPPLTTIRQPNYEMGKLSAQTLINIIKGENQNLHQILLQPQLVIRHSCGCKQDTVK